MKPTTSQSYTRFLYGGISLLVGLMGLASCEDVIDIDLKNADQVIVIEGNVANNETTHYVNISKTVPFSSNGTDNPQAGAIVSIREEHSATVSNSAFAVPTKAERTFTEVGPGLYEIRDYRANPGMKYTLIVTVENIQYVASSIMPTPIAIDSIGTVTNNIFGEDEKTISVVYQDPPNVKNYFRYLLTVNNEPTDLIFAYRDKLNDGKEVQRDLYHEDLDLVIGDSVIVEQRCMDEAVYTYFEGIQSNNPGSAAPANPITNFSNGALGYFSAHSVTRASTRVE